MLIKPSLVTYHTKTAYHATKFIAIAQSSPQVYHTRNRWRFIGWTTEASLSEGNAWSLCCIVCRTYSWATPLDVDPQMSECPEESDRRVINLIQVYNKVEYINILKKSYQALEESNRLRFCLPLIGGWLMQSDCSGWSIMIHHFANVKDLRLLAPQLLMTSAKLQSVQRAKFLLTKVRL
jgi:hypothetical protein